MKTLVIVERMCGGGGKGQSDERKSCGGEGGGGASGIDLGKTRERKVGGKEEEELVEAYGRRWVGVSKGMSCGA